MGPTQAVFFYLLVVKLECTRFIRNETFFFIFERRLRT